MTKQSDRDKSAGRGTMPNGSYPVNNQTEANSAYRLRGKSKDYTEAQVVRHIRSRVKSLGLKDPSK